MVNKNIINNTGTKGGSPLHISKKEDKPKAITTKMVLNTMANSAPRRKAGAQIRPKNERAEFVEINLEDSIPEVKLSKKSEGFVPIQSRSYQDFNLTEINNKEMNCIVEEEIAEIHESEVEPPSEIAGAIKLISESQEKSPGKANHQTKINQQRKIHTTMGNNKNSLTIQQFKPIIEQNEDFTSFEEKKKPGNLEVRASHGSPINTQISLALQDSEIKDYNPKVLINLVSFREHKIHMRMQVIIVWEETRRRKNYTLSVLNLKLHFQNSHWSRQQNHFHFLHPTNQMKEN